MKGKIRFFGIIAMFVIITFSLVNCGSDNEGEDWETKGDIETNGTLTINGIPVKYNEKYIDGLTLMENNPSYHAYDKIYYNGINYEQSKGIINNGTVTLKVWSVYDDGKYKSFNESGKTLTFRFYIFDSEGSVSTGSGDVTATFTNGKGSGTFIERQLY